METSKYIALLKKCLIDYQHIGTNETFPLNNVPPSWKIHLLKPFDKLLRKRNFGIFKLIHVEAEKRLNGYDWPARAKTMVGLHRLNHVESCIYDIIKENVEGDFVETGIWRGGVIMLMKAILEEFQITNRKIWAFDSFEGLPKPDLQNYPQDSKSNLHKMHILNASLQEVKDNFKRYDISTDQVVFKKGWFKDTLPKNDIKSISFLRLDGDLYESTMLALEHLYPKLSKKGFIIIDDYNAFDFCKKAVIDYRNKMNIQSSIIPIDKEAIYWRK